MQDRKGSVLFNELENTQLYNAARDKVKTLRQQGADKEYKMPSKKQHDSDREYEAVPDRKQQD